MTYWILNKIRSYHNQGGRKIYRLFIKEDNIMRKDFLKDESQEAIQNMAMGSIDSRLPLIGVKIKPEGLTGNEWLHALEATIDTKEHRRCIRIRIYANGRGMNVTVPCITDAMYNKFRDLRFQIRNQDYVEIAFDEFNILTSSRRAGEVYVLAYDFKIKGI